MIKYVTPRGDPAPDDDQPATYVEHLVTHTCFLHQCEMGHRYQHLEVNETPDSRPEVMAAYSRLVQANFGMVPMEASAFGAALDNLPRGASIRVSQEEWRATMGSDGRDLDVLSMMAPTASSVPETSPTLSQIDNPISTVGVPAEQDDEPAAIWESPVMSSASTSSASSASDSEPAEEPGVMPEPDAEP